MMAGWASKPKSGGLASGNEIMMMGLLQNCDLPPPAKVFAGSDKAAAVFSPMNFDGLDHVPGTGTETGKYLELLTALRLSQTRAREAEKKVAVLARERDCLWNAFLGDSSRLFAYRQWVKLFEVQLSMLRRQRLQPTLQFCSGCRQSNSNGMKGSSLNKELGGDGEDVGGGGMTWFVALALCLGIAGVGFAFGCSYLF